MLCWGGTGRFDAYEYGERFFVNPGSGTGVGGGEASFCLMDVSCFLSGLRRRGGGEIRSEANCDIGARDFAHAVRVSAEDG